MRSCQANLLQSAAFKKSKENLKLQAPILRLPASSEQGTRTSTIRKTLEVEEVDPTASTKGAKPSGEKLIKTVAKKSIAKKPRAVDVTLDTSIIEVEPLDEEFDDAATLSAFMRDVNEYKQILGGVIEAQEALEAEDRKVAQEYKEAKQFIAALKAKTRAEEAERKCLEAEVEERRKAKKAEEERISEIERRLEIKKKEKAEAEQKKQQELEKRKKEKEE